MSVTLHSGDCRAILPTLPAESVQCVVTSPPYYGLRDYGVAGQIGMEPSPQEYVDELVAVFREVRRVLRKDGTLWLNLGDSYNAAGRIGHGTHIGYKQGTNRASANGTDHTRASDDGLKPKDLMLIPARVAIALQADGWWLRSDIIWAKPNPMPESVTDRPTSAHEHVFLLTKAATYFYDADAVAEPGAAVLPNGKPAPRAKYGGALPSERVNGAYRSGGIGNSRVPYNPAEHTRNLRNVWTIATQPYAEAHFATFPPELAERCIKAGTSEKGQCPCCGAPWVRVVERQASKPGVTGGSAWNGAPEQISKGLSRGGGFGGGAAETTGWAPSCACPEHLPVPQTVLDPFCGACTTGLVADRLGRNAVLIELSPAYSTMGHARIVADGPLFAEVAVGQLRRAGAASS